MTRHIVPVIRWVGVAVVDGTVPIDDVRDGLAYAWPTLLAAKGLRPTATPPEYEYRAPTNGAPRCVTVAISAVPLRVPPDVAAMIDTRVCEPYVEWDDDTPNALPE